MWQFKVIVLVLAVTLTNSISLDFRTALLDMLDSGVHWALIISGSIGWGNYRHQADICHAYQLLSRNGIPDERIVVMMYDDIAFNRENPHPGVVINHINGSNLYKGVPKDYTKDAVTPDVFLRVLQGKKAGLSSIGSGKVIDSGPNDHVFVYFADHGAPGLIAFPDGELYATQLIKALKNMYEQKRYSKMVIYIEACESGSMFKNLPKDINIFGVTAANGKESSYACYYDDKLETYLGDVFSVVWMENTDAVSIDKVTIQEQFQIVKKKVNTSHVQEFGDMSIGQMRLSAFQGTKASAHPPTSDSMIPSFDMSNSVHSREVALHILEKKYAKATNYHQKQIILLEIFVLHHEQSKIHHTFRSIVEDIVGANGFTEDFLRITDEIENDECYEEAVNTFRNTCTAYRRSEHVLGHFKTFVNLCNARFPTDQITHTIKRVCRQQGQL